MNEIDHVAIHDLGRTLQIETGKTKPWYISYLFRHISIIKKQSKKHASGG
jgi:hypothetical protein